MRGLRVRWTPNARLAKDETLHSVRTELTTPLKLWRRWREKGDRASARRLEAARTAFYLELWSRTAAELGAEVEQLGDERLRIRRERAWTVVRRFEVSLDTRLALQLAGDKPFTLARLAEADVPTPRHAVFESGEAARAWSWISGNDDVGKAVVKPARNGSAGKGVTTGVASRALLERAFKRAAAYDGSILVEEHVEGTSFRLAYLRGAYVDAIRRDSPTLIGDGSKTLGELIARENESRLSGEVRAFHLLVSDLELRETLASQGLQLSSVPAKDARVTIKRAVNQGSEHDAQSIREEVHPDWIEAGARAARALGIEWAGVDVLATDLSRPPSEGGVVNEVNTTPALHHHLLVRNKSAATPVARLLLEELLTPAAWRTREEVEA